MTKQFHLYVKVDARPLLSPKMQPYADFANYIQHRILIGKMYWQAKDTGFVPLKAKYLRRVIPKLVLSPLLAELQALGIIRRDNHYIEGQESIGYRFGAAYADRETFRIPCHRIRCATKIAKFAPSTDRMMNYTKVHRHLRANLKHLRLDLATALALDKDGVATDLIRYIAHGDALDDFTVCDYGRVHTAVTRLLKPIRGLLFYDAEPLIELDIANSQPLFLCLAILDGLGLGFPPVTLPVWSPLVYSPPVWSPLIYPKTGLRHIPTGLRHYPISSISPSSLIEGLTPRPLYTHLFSPVPAPHILPPPSPLSLLYGVRLFSKSLETKGLTPLKSSSAKQPYLPPDLMRFIALCEKGELYPELKRLCEFEGALDEFKVQLIATLYDRLKDDPITRTLQKHFPSVHAFIHSHKRQQGYKALAQAMQRAESHFIIETVCVRIMQEQPDCPLVTVHDSILTTPGFVAYVRQVMAEEFAKQQRQPTIRQKERKTHV